jgi:hypothetical protein
MNAIKYLLVIAVGLPFAIIGYLAGFAINGAVAGFTLQRKLHAAKEPKS